MSINVPLAHSHLPFIPHPSSFILHPFSSLRLCVKAHSPTPMFYVLCSMFYLLIALYQLLCYTAAAFLLRRLVATKPNVKTGQTRRKESSSGSMRTLPAPLGACCLGNTLTPCI